MSGLLGTDALQGIFGSVLSSIYEDGQLIRVVMQWQPGGTEIPVEQPPVACKVQVDVCTEAMRQQEGYSDTDVRLLVLQSTVAGADLTSDDIIVAKDFRTGDWQRWKLYGLTQDPARAYWEMRGIRDANS
ncbi:hypothetical protein [Nitratireductor sp. GCM10026969]|uniref:hypothetical protein n=1 Tax=Nitratireductor sp. GCM10026969 TaxID=3252645 RepID=UPI0036157ACD